MEVVKGPETGRWLLNTLVPLFCEAVEKWVEEQYQVNRLYTHRLLAQW